jgi:choline dehydrogenase
MRPIVIKEFMPGLNVTSDKDILKYIMASSYQNWHASCTCGMGRSEDPMAVVDTHAKVIGVQGLRVVDASSFALLPPGHPQSTVCKLVVKEGYSFLSRKTANASAFRCFSGENRCRYISRNVINII